MGGGGELDRSLQVRKPQNGLFWVLKDYKTMDFDGLEKSLKVTEPCNALGWTGRVLTDNRTTECAGVGWKGP